MLNLVKGAAGWSWKLNDMGTEMIFVKTFTVAHFGHVIFYPKARNSLES